MSLWRGSGVKAVRLDRLQEYPSTSLSGVCAKLGLEPITPEQLAAAVPNDPAGGHSRKHGDHLGRVKFFVEYPSDDEHDAIMICDGRPYGRPDLDEPHIYDGLHRLAAAILRGDRTINAVFRWGNDATVFVSRPVIAYLTGDSDKKPRGTSREWRESDEYEEWY